MHRFIELGSKRTPRLDFISGTESIVATCWKHGTGVVGQNDEPIARSAEFGSVLSVWTTTKKGNWKALRGRRVE